MITSTSRPLDSFDHETWVAVHVVADAMRLARSLEGRAHPATKSDQSPVTVAAGASDLLLRLPPHPGFHDAVWDQAAGSLLIEEAGGRVTDLAGQSLDFSTGRRLLRNTGMVGSNGLLHAAVLEALHLAR